MRGMKLLALISLAVVLSGCETINVHRKFSTTDQKAHTIFVDAKQRAVIAVPVPTQVVTQSTINGVSTTVTSTSSPLRICAEPSPDALTAIATAARASANVKDQVNVAAAFERAESAASIGLRTQSITLMRDVLFRICEQYQSGALTPAAVETLERRYQSSMVAILAIEQLTGAVRAPAVNLGSKSSNGGADSVAAIYKAQSEASTASIAADSKAVSARKDRDTAKAALAALLADGGEADPSKMDTARKTKYDGLNGQVTKTEGDLTTADSDAKLKAGRLKDANLALAAIGAGDGSAEASAEIATLQQHELSDAATASIATAVQNIVSDAMQLGFLRETCATLLVASIEGRSSIAPAATPVGFADSCKTYFDTTVASLGAANEKQLAVAGLISRTPPSERGFEALAKILAALNAGAGSAPAAMPAVR